MDLLNMEIEVLGMLCGNYIIIEVDGDAAPVQVSSPGELRDHLRDRGLTELQIAKALEARSLSLVESGSRSSLSAASSAQASVRLSGAGA
jgi:hypothetical protein